MLGSPLATSEGVIDVVTNVRNYKEPEYYHGKTGRIDVRHFEGFREVLDSSWEGN